MHGAQLVCYNYTYYVTAANSGARLSMSNESQGEHERNELAEHLNALQAIQKNTTDAHERTALERVIIYLGNRLADILETPEG